VIGSVITPQSQVSGALCPWCYQVTLAESLAGVGSCNCSGAGFIGVCLYVVTSVTVPRVLPPEVSAGIRQICSALHRP